MPRDHLAAEEGDRAQVLERPRLDDRRRESLARVAEHDQATVGHRDRPEEAGLGVRHRLHVAGRDFVAEDVRDAGVVAAAVEIAAILREDEALGRRLAEAELAQRGGVPGEQRRERPHAQELVAADVGDRCRQQPAVGRDVELARHHAVGKLVHRLPADVGIGNAHQRRQPGVVAHADQRTVDGVERDAADAGLLQEDRLLSAVDVDRDQVAKAQVVGREEGPAAGGIEGQRGDRIEHRALDLGQGPRAAVAHVQCGDVIDDARVTHAGVEDAARFVEIRARDRAHRGGCEVALRRDRMLANFGEIAALELVLEGDPVLPGPLERDAEHLLELIGVVAAAALVTTQPGDDLLGRVGVGEPGEEAPAVQIGVGAALEIDAGAARHEAERVVEVRVVAHHGAKHHLVVAALRAAEAARHPGLHEHGAAFQIPARHRESRHRQVAVEQRLGMARLRRHLAEEEAAPAPILARREVGRRDVHHLVVHRRVHALVARVGLERIGHRCDVDPQERLGRRRDARVAIVGEVAQPHGRPLRGLPAEDPALPVECVAERARGVRNEEVQARVRIEQTQLAGVDEGDAERAGLGDGEERKAQQGTQRLRQTHSAPPGD